MGTNFYLWQKEELPTEETIDSAMHIGKRSAGWVFQFQSYSEAKTLKEMKELTKNGTIYDEYLSKYTYEQFWAEVEETKEPFGGRKPYVLEDPSDPHSFDPYDYEESGFSWTPFEFS